jgi:hypothetical protein
MGFLHLAQIGGDVFLVMTLTMDRARAHRTHRHRLMPEAVMVKSTSSTYLSGSRHGMQNGARNECRTHVTSRRPRRLSASRPFFVHPHPQQAALTKSGPGSLPRPDLYGAGTHPPAAMKFQYRVSYRHCQSEALPKPRCCIRSSGKS